MSELQEIQRVLNAMRVDVSQIAQGQSFANERMAEYIARSEVRFERLMRRHNQWDVVIAVLCWLVTPSLAIAALSRLMVP